MLPADALAALPDPSRAGGDDLRKSHFLCSPRFWVGPLDLRPLGFMRLAFGAVLFFATLVKAQVLFDYFSDEGVAPRAAVLGSLVRANRICVFDVAGPSWVLVSLYLLTLAAIAAFTAGFHTRAATIATFVLVTGLHERNLLVFHAGDDMSRVLLFWLMFMPSGARYSLDARRRAARGEGVLTHASAFPMRLAQLQIAWVYVDSLIMRWPGKEWHDGTAVRIALGLDHLFTTPLGRLLFDQRWFSALGSHATVWVQLLCVPLLFLGPDRPSRGPLARWPRWLFQPTYKALGVAALTVFHVAILLCMNIGNCPYIHLAALFLLWEPAWIDALVRRLGFGAQVPSTAQLAIAWPWRLQHAALGILFAAAVWFSLPDVTRLPALDVGGRTLIPALDISPSRMPRGLHDAIQEVELWQKWDYFSPKPLDHDVYIEGRGQLTDGTEVDVLRGDRGDGRGPLVPRPVPGGQWIKYTNNIVYESDNSPWTLELGRFICRRWNFDSHRGRAQLKTFKLYREERRVPGFDEPEDVWHEQMIWDHHCF